MLAVKSTKREIFNENLPYDKGGYDGIDYTTSHMNHNEGDIRVQM